MKTALVNIKETVEVCAVRELMIGLLGLAVLLSANLALGF